jgi:hypothetical protein
MNPRFVCFGWNSVCVTTTDRCNTREAAENPAETLSTTIRPLCVTDGGAETKRRPHMRDAGVRANLEAARALPRDGSPGRVSASEGVAA